MNASDPLRPLLFALSSPSPADRAAAALALNRRSTERLPKSERRRLTRGLIDALRDADARVRRLAEIGLEDADFSAADRRALARPPRTAAACRLLRGDVPALRRALLDRSPQVRRAAGRALAEAEGAWAPCAPRHETPIETLDISPDGRLLASGSQDGALLIRDLASGRALFSLRRPGEEPGGVRSVAFHPSGSRLAVGDERGLTLLDPWTARVTCERRSWKKDWFFGGRFMERGSCFISRAHFIDAQGRSQRTLKLKEEAYAIDISRDLSTLLVRGEGGLSVLDGRSAEIRLGLPLAGEFGSWEGMALSPDGRFFAAAAGSGTDVQLWDARTGEKVAEWRERAPWGTTALEFSSDGRRLACGSGVLDIASRAWLWRHPSSTWIRAARFTPDGAFLATAGDDHVVTLRDAATGRKARAWGVPRNEVEAIRVHGARLAVGYEDGRVDVRRGKRADTRQAGFRVRSLSFSPDGRRLACAGDESHAKLFGPDGVRELRPWDGRVESVAWSPRGNLLALGGRSQEAAQVATSDADHKLFTPLRLPSGKTFKSVSDLTYAPDGLILAGILDGTPVVWKEEGQPRCLPKLDWTCGLAFSPDGRLLAGGTTGYQVVLWDVENLQIKDILRTRRDAPSEIAFSPDGRRLACMTAYDSAVEVRDVATGARLAVLKGHAGSGRAVAWGRRLVTGAADGRLIFWPGPGLGPRVSS